MGHIFMVLSGSVLTDMWGLLSQNDHTIMRDARFRFSESPLYKDVAPFFFSSK